MKLNAEKRAEFWSNVDVRSETECWEWTGGKHEGYGRFWANGRDAPAHRVAFLDSGGVLSEEKPMVLHRCGRKPCVNPRHLYAGSYQDNADDAARLGEQARGADVHGAKLNDDSVLSARRRYRARSASVGEMSREFGVSKGNMAKAIDGRSYAHLPGAVELRPADQRIKRRPSAKLDAEQETEIARMRADGATWVSIGLRFGVHPTTASQAADRLRKRIDDAERRVATE